MDYPNKWRALSRKSKAFIFLLIGLWMWFTIQTIVVIADGLNDEIAPADVAIVFGSQVLTNGQPSLLLKSRLDKTLELYQKGYFKTIIVSGGFGKEGYDEAEVMRNYLAERQIPTSSIIMDSQGNNSRLTAVHSKQIMDNLGLKSALAITNYYHITRARLALHRVGINNAYTTHANFFELRDLYSIVREFAAYYKYLFY